MHPKNKPLANTIQIINHDDLWVYVVYSILSFEHSYSLPHLPVMQHP